MKQQFIEDVTGTIRLTVYDTNRPVVPSSATITLTKPDGSSLQSAASVTIDSTTGEMTYSLTTTHTADRGLNYKAVWAYVSSGTTYYQTQLFDIVRSVLAVSITDVDLYNELETLREVNKQETGTATSATTSTLLDTANRKESDNFWKGGTLEILSGTGSGQTRDITAFTQSTSTITVTPNFVTTPDTTSTYRVVRSFTTKINQAFNQIESMLYNKGRRHELILESSQIEVPLLYLTIHIICLDNRDEQGDKWDMLAKDYLAKFDTSFNTLKLDYDEDDSGTIQGEEQQSSTGGFRIFRS